MGLYESLAGARKMLGIGEEASEHLQIKLVDDPSSDPISLYLPPPGAERRSDGAIVPAMPPSGAGTREALSNGNTAITSIVEDAWSTQQEVYRERYDKSIDTIKTNIFAVAGALTTLDSIESKLILIQTELDRIRNEGKQIDCEKVEIALRRITEYINTSISRIDDQCVNLLRDAKLEIRLAEIHNPDNASAGFELTMISPESFFKHKLARAAAEGLPEEEIAPFVNGLKAIVSTNIHILSSVLLVLFATRDYTQAVTKLASREGIIPQIEIDEPAGAELPIEAGRATLDRLKFEDVERKFGADAGNTRPRTASLSELLDKVRSHRAELPCVTGHPGERIRHG